MNEIRRSPLVHALIVMATLLIHVASPAPIARACEDCWPVYYEVLYNAPSNWVTVGQYQPGDWVWIRSQNVGGYSYYTQWFVMEANDPGWWDQPHPCCNVGPWFITEEGGLYLIW